MGVKTKEYEENNGEGVSWKMRGRKGYSGKNRKEDSNAGLKNEGEERESVFRLSGPFCKIRQAVGYCQ